MSVLQRVKVNLRSDPLAEGDATLTHAGMLLCLMVVALPVLLVDTPPIFDYPNHLARAHVIARLDQSAVLAAHFQLTSFLIPNVLADLLLLALLPFTGIMVAGKMLLILTFSLTLSGAYVLNRLLTGRFSPWPLAVAALLYNEGFFWGFLNYNLGLGVLMWGLVAWGALDRRSAGKRIAVGSCFALLIFLSHLVAFGLYGVAVAAIELRRVAVERPDRREGAARLAQAAAQFIAPLALFLSLSPSGELELVALFDFSVYGKVMPFARLLSSGNPALDFATLAALAALVATGLTTGAARCQGLLAMLAAVFLVLVLTLPYSMLGSYFLDSRIIIAVALLFAASLTPASRAPAGPLVLVILTIVAGRSLGLLADWRGQAEDYQAVVAALDQVPRGSVIVTSVGYPFEIGDWIVSRHIQPAHEHTTLYATIRRDAVVPNIFARRGQNPLVFASTLDELNRLARNPVGRVFHAGDARWMVGEVMPLSERRATITPAIPAVYIIGYRVPCAWWPVDMPIRPVACTASFSLIELLDGNHEPVP